MTFDAYHEWLGISPEEQPANYYRLLGLRDAESSLSVIENAAYQRLSHIKNFQNGPHAAESQDLLNEISQARLCLLNPESKAAYDKQLEVEANDRRLEVEASELEALEEEIEPTSNLFESLPEAQLIVAEPQTRKIQGKRVYAAALFFVVVVTLTLGWYFGGFGNKRGEPEPGENADSKVETSPQRSGTNSLGSTEANVAAQASPSLMDALKSSMVLRMTFDRATVVTNEEGKQLVNDLSGNGNHGMVQGAQWVEGLAGEAIRFKGRSYVDCGQAGSLNPGAAFSVSAWVKPTKLPDYPRILSKVGAYELRWAWQRSDPGPPKFTGVFGTVRAPRTPPYGRWHHMVITYGKRDEQATLRMYHNGKLIAEHSPGGNQSGKTGGRLILGVSDRTNRYEHYTGLLDELTILNKELSAAEVEQLFQIHSDKIKPDD